MIFFYKPLLLIAFFILLLSNRVNAQTPVQGINYQAVARDATGNELLNAAVGLRMTILLGPLPGTVVFRETHVVATNEFGLFNLVIGKGIAVTGDLFAILWDSGPYFLEVAIDPLGGTNYTGMGIIQFQAVPYAFAAGVAANGPRGPAGPIGAANIDGTTNHVVKFTSDTTGGDSQLMDNGTNVGIGTSFPAAKLHVLSNDSIGFRVDCNMPIALMAVNSISPTPDPGYAYLHNGSLAGGHHITTTGDWKLELGPHNPLIVNSLGNVGIGTSTPSKRLDVNGNTNLAGGVSYNRSVPLAAYTTLSSDYIVETNGFNITLENASSAGEGRIIIIRNIGSTITIFASSGNTLHDISSGNPVSSINVNSGAVKFYSDGGTKWYQW